MLRVFLSILTMFLGVSAVSAEDTWAVVLEGKCQELVVVDKVMTQACEDAIMVANTPRGGMITQVMRTGGAHNFYLTGKPEGTVQWHEIEVSLYPMEERWASMGISGTCAIEDIGNLPAKVTCEGVDPNGFTYKLRFRAVRSEPLEIPQQ